MVYLPLALATALLLSSISTLPPLAIGTQTQLEPCRKKSGLGEREVNIHWELCPQKDTKNSYHRDNGPKVEKVTRPKYNVREFDECNSLNENFLNCFSNPDTETCEDGTYPIIRQLISLEGENKGEVFDSYRVCPEDPADPRTENTDEEIIEISIDQFRSFPISPSNIVSSPSKFSLRNGHTHMWASREVQTFDVDVEQSAVRIKAIPIQWNWNYGDGTTRSLDFPGEAAPNHTLHDETPTSHSYKETGTFSVGATTLYRGEFSVDGGPWQAIPGQAAVPSDPIEIDVWRTEKELIAID